ncbi:hypothetical protein N657DRAFT_690567 [Parathielavia appendiculata]|uniref:BRCT domain-containing protein n=1 Tax=Parathielavia appendiculata TaxID=2587402 RepID=A0AAN6U0A8_9PEZI|nr:hypothetical protein N657DRAFT_690567 [Parathielavia appendiculata]
MARMAKHKKLAPEEKTIFRGLTIARAGDLNAKKGRRKQWSDASIAQWVVLHGSKFVGEKLDGDVTHPVWSKEEFRRMLPLGKRLRTCKFVKLDWLEDSIHEKKRLPEAKDSHVEALKREHERERVALMVIKGQEKAEKEVDTNFYRVYRDHTYFPYEVKLKRTVWVAKEGVFQEEKFTLSLYGSYNDEPHLYWFVAKFSKKKGDSQPSFHRPGGSPGVFAREFTHFKYFFQTETASRIGIQRNKLMRTQRGGKPVGRAPAQYIPAEIAVIDTADATTADPTGTAQPVIPPAMVADTHNGHGEDTLSKIAAVAAKISDASSPADQLMTPASSPRADLSITVASFLPQERDEKHGDSATPLVDTPHSS